MNTKLIAKVTSKGKLEIPPEILQQLQPNSEYEISITEDEINLIKTQKNLTLDEFLEIIDNSEPDPEQPTLEEISEIVKEVRKELWGKKYKKIKSLDNKTDTK
jgi:bifunctional DNA-binding transcriptional regulator/antitoxin component of YhaV-PrlF toxin-antitoxin module